MSKKVLFSIPKDSSEVVLVLRYLDSKIAAASKEEDRRVYRKTILGVIATINDLGNKTRVEIFNKNKLKNKISAEYKSQPILKKVEMALKLRAINSEILFYEDFLKTLSIWAKKRNLPS